MSVMDKLIDRLNEWRDTRSSGQRHTMISLEEVEAILDAKQAQLDAAIGIAPARATDRPKIKKRVVKTSVKKVAKNAVKKTATKKKARR